MVGNIRDKRVKPLAKELADFRRVTIGHTCVDGLSNVLERERQKVHLKARIEELRQAQFKGVMRGHDMTKAEIDAMWGQ